MSAPHSPGGVSSSEAHQVRRDGDQRVHGVGPLAELPVVVHRTVRRRILKQNAEHLFADRRFPPITDDDVHAASVSARLHHLDRLRMALVRDEERLLARLAVHAVRHGHRFGRRGAFVEQRRVRDLEAREIDHHRLVGEQRLESPLGDLRLIRRVRRVPARILQHVALDDRRRDAVGVTEPEIRSRDLVAAGDGPQRRERFVLGHRRVNRQRTIQSDARRNRRVDQCIQRVVAEQIEHRAHLGL